MVVGIVDIFDLRPNIGHDLGMFTLQEHFEIAPVLNILQISASFYCFWLTIPPYIPIYE